MRGTLRLLTRRWMLVSALAGALMALIAGAAFGVTGSTSTPTQPKWLPGTQYPQLDEESEEALLEQDRAFVAGRTAGDDPLDIEHAAQLRAKAAHAAKQIGKTAPPSGPTTFSGAWTPDGPSPIGEPTRSAPVIGSMNGRVGALAVEPKTGRIILGAAQGGIWTRDGSTWTPRTNSQETQAIGALAIAPSDPKTVYAGTGEGAMSGDSYFGDGILKSTDGGTTWSKVSGDYFQGVSTSRIAVDPTDAQHLYAAILRGRGGSRRVTVQPHSRFGIWESHDGGTTWTLLREVDEAHGATDLEIDPQNPDVMYASFLSDGIYKSTDAGAHWTSLNGNFGLASPDFSGADFRAGLSISHPNPGGDGVLYAGFPWSDADGEHESRVWRSTDGGASWQLTADGAHDGSDDDSVANYCDIQCTYDNVIEADPDNPDVVFAAGEYGYDLHPQSGGIYRSDDGGKTWLNLGWNQHPDFHAFAWDPTNAGHVVFGNDGGVYDSPDLGGRASQSQPLSAADWRSLNGGGLAIAQFSSIATNPQTPDQLWGGTQDNGTETKFYPSSRAWYDMTSGDGGQVLVDPTDSDYVYGEYYGVSPYRITDGGAAFFTNKTITRGINTRDRSEFYLPFVLNQDDPNQLFTGTFRMYRTDNAKAPSAGDVTWKPISGDLTSGCPGAAPNGGRGCVISAIGLGGGDGAYAGTEEGYVWVSPDAQTADSPSWTRVDENAGILPNRPVGTIAVDRSNYRVAYAGYNGFDAATPKTPGHVFKTTDGGKHWANVTGNLPDSPVNSIVIDPSYANTLYAGTDVGPFVSYDGGGHWGHMGSGFPMVSVWQLDMDTSHRTIAAGSHGRSAFTLTDDGKVPALELSGASADRPIGPGTDVQYTFTVRNIGNAPASGVQVTDKMPPNTTFVSAGQGGTRHGTTVTWSGLKVPAGESSDVTVTLHIGSTVDPGVTSITNDGYRATSAEGPSADGSPVVTAFAPPHAVSAAPATQAAGAHPGQSFSYHVAVRNRGSDADSYALSLAGNWSAQVLDSGCTSPMASTASLAPGDTADVCVKVTVPAGADDMDTDTATLTATSAADPTVTATAAARTIAVTRDTLLVDGDTNAPVDSQPIYKAALDGAGVPFSTWDLAKDPDLPQNYMKAFKNIVWFTGNSYPGPLQQYEQRLASFLDDGGNLLVSGQDILDQGAGTTDFVHDYLHIDWDGTERQNDQLTKAVHGVSGTLSDGVGDVPLDHEVLHASYEDQISPTTGATGIFTDDSTATDALSFAGSYKVVFLAFPLEAYGSDAQKADLVGRVMNFFGS